MRWRFSLESEMRVSRYGVRVLEETTWNLVLSIEISMERSRMASSGVSG